MDDPVCMHAFGLFRHCERRVRYKQKLWDCIVILAWRHFLLGRFRLLNAYSVIQTVNSAKHD